MNRRFSAVLISAAVAASALFTGCGDKYGLNPNEPVTITVWHYYSGMIKNEFDNLVNTFNDTVGSEEGIIVEAHSYGNISDLEGAVTSSINNEVGSEEMPDIFGAYADIALFAQKADKLAELNNYFTDEELDEYVGSYIDEGRIGGSDKVYILPVAKSTEIFMLNKTDWQPFADACGISQDELTTKEGIVRTAEKYYGWTDALTPNVPNDGKAFYGRDSLANYFIIGAKQLDNELFGVDGSGNAKLNIDDKVMRRLWDCYYVPYINGWFSDDGKYRSDAAKVGEILSYTGSSSSALYFPTAVTEADDTHDIEVLVMPSPVFEGGSRYAVQQGAGMVVTKSDPKHEYASTEFLKWFTDSEQNIVFAAKSGYLPVKKDANSFEVYSDVCSRNGIPTDAVTEATLKCAFEASNSDRLYTNKPFDGGSDARNALSSSIISKSHDDRAEILELIKGGMSVSDAVARYDTDENFNEWLGALKNDLEKTIQKD